MKPKVVMHHANETNTERCPSSCTTVFIYLRDQREHFIFSPCQSQKPTAGFQQNLLVTIHLMEQQQGYVKRQTFQGIEQTIPYVLQLQQHCIKQVWMNNLSWNKLVIKQTGHQSLEVTSVTFLVAILERYSMETSRIHGLWYCLLVPRTQKQYPATNS